MTAVVRHLGTIDFNSVVDGDGTRWGCDSIEGWYDGPSMRQGTLNVAGEWGGVVTENLYGPRMLLLRGWAVPGSAVTTAQMVDKLNNVSNATTGTVTLKVDENPAKQVNAKRNGETRVRLMGGSERILEFEVPLIAPDPRKYSQTLTQTTITLGSGVSSNSATIPNAGTVAMYPESIVISGTGTQPLTVTVGTRAVTLTTSLSTNRYILYPQTGQVYYGASGSEVTHAEYATAAPKFQIAVGGSSMTVTRTGTTGTMTVDVYSRAAWI